MKLVIAVQLALWLLAASAIAGSVYAANIYQPVNVCDAITGAQCLTVNANGSINVATQ